MCRRILLSLLLLSACFTAVFSQGWQSAPGSLTLSETQRASIMMLITELQILNSSLNSELTSSQTDLNRLRQNLSAAERKFQTLSAELTALKSDSIELRQELQTAQKSLTTLQNIFSEYQKKARGQIEALEIQRNIAAGAGAGGIIAAFIVGILLF